MHRYKMKETYKVGPLNSLLTFNSAQKNFIVTLSVAS